MTKRSVYAVAMAFILVCSSPGWAAEAPIGAPGYVVPSGTHGAVSAPESEVADPQNWGGTSRTAVTFNSMAFSPLQNGEWSHLQSGWSARTGGTNTATCVNVNLPSGSLLEAITTYTDDTDAANGVSYTLFSINLATSVGTTPFTFATAATPGIERILHTLATPITVNNDRNAYALCVFQAVSATTRNAGATFWYRLQVSPAPATATFADVPVGSGQHRFVEALAAAGITGGCGGGNYCPNDPVTRGQMAVFLSAALGLHFPN